MKINRKINGTTWSFEVVSTKQMKKERHDGEHLAGLCISSEKRILIEKNHVQQDIILHELFHAYVSDLCLSDTNNLSFDDTEEIFANLVTSKGDKMLRQARRITKDLKKMMKED